MCSGSMMAEGTGASRTKQNTWEQGSAPVRSSLRLSFSAQGRGPTLSHLGMTLSRPSGFPCFGFTLQNKAFRKLESRECRSQVEMGTGSHLPFLHPPRSPAWSRGTFCAPDARNLPRAGRGVNLSAPSPAPFPSPSLVWGLPATPAPECIQRLVLFLGARLRARRPPPGPIPPSSRDQTPAPCAAPVNRLPRAKARALFNAAPQLPPDL